MIYQRLYAASSTDNFIQIRSKDYAWLRKKSESWTTIPKEHITGIKVIPGVNPEMVYVTILIEIYSLVYAWLSNKDTNRHVYNIIK